MGNCSAYAFAQSLTDTKVSSCCQLYPRDNLDLFRRCSVYSDQATRASSSTDRVDWSGWRVAGGYCYEAIAKLLLKQYRGRRVRSQQLAHLELLHK